MFNFLFLSVLVVFLLGFLVGILFLILTLVEQIQYWDTPKKMLFLPSNIKSISPIAVSIIKQYSPENSNNSLVELGCGRAGFLREISKHFKFQKIIGIEGQYSVWLQAKLLNIFGKINLIRGDIFDFQSDPNSVIYCYLGEKLMTLLYEAKKFDKCLVISLDYKISTITPTEEINIPNQGKNSKIQKILYVYDLRTRL
jgi:hypothetical protein